MKDMFAEFNEIQEDVASSTVSLQKTEATTVARRKLTEKMESLSESDKRQLEQIKKSIQPGNFASVQDYAKSTINITNQVVDNVLKAANSGALDSIGGDINNILMTAKKIDASQLVSASKSNNVLTRFFPFFFRTKERIVAQFTSLGDQIGKYAEEITKSLKVSEKSVQTLEEMKIACIKQYQQLEYLILAGRARAEELREEYESDKAKMAAIPQDEIDALQLQELQRKEQFIDTLDKKVSNLEQAQQVVYLQIPQLTIMIKNGVDTRTEFQQIIDMTIPLWKQQFTQALIQDQQKRSSDLVKANKDFTNNMLMKSADDLKVTTLQIAEQGSRGLIDRNTLEHVQTQLIDTFNGVADIHRKTKEERLQVTQTISQLRVDFKNSLQNT